MSRMRSVLLQILYDEWQVRAQYVQLLKSVIEMEFSGTAKSDFFDSKNQRAGVIYRLGDDEIFLIKPNDSYPEQLLIPSRTLRENLLDFLACHPMYAKWFAE